DLLQMRETDAAVVVPVGDQLVERVLCHLLAYPRSERRTNARPVLFLPLAGESGFRHKEGTHVCALPPYRRKQSKRGGLAWTRLWRCRGTSLRHWSGRPSSASGKRSC